MSNKESGAQARLYYTAFNSIAPPEITGPDALSSTAAIING